MRVIKIFLASSEELKEDRRAFELMIGRLNKHWRQRDILLDLVVWEYFLDAMTGAGLQKEYNQAIRDCDIFVMMFFTRVGRYTLEEFEAALADMATGDGPHIYTYFKNDFILTGDIGEGIKSLLDFKARLRELQHYVTQYRNTEDLQWQFSRQLEMLYGDVAGSFEITEATPQAKIDENALVLGYRQLFDVGGSQAVDPKHLGTAVQKAGSRIRGAIFNLAQDVRRENWATDKHLMARTIPIFEALVRADPKWHAYHGQLGYALKDQAEPDWRRAKACLDQAVELRGDQVGEGLYYQFNRALCAINLDANYAGRKPADAATREQVVGILKQARRDLDDDWDNLLATPDAADIRTWLNLNGSPRLR